MRGSLLRATVVAVLISIVTVGQVGAQEPPRPGRAGLLDELGRGRIERHAQTGQLRFAGGTANRPSATSARLGRPANAREAARAYVSRYGALFGLSDADRGVRVARSVAAGNGRTFIRLQQVQGGVPVLAGELTVQVDGAGNVISALGEASPASAIDLEPQVSAGKAQQTALAVTARARGLSGGSLHATTPALWIYDPALVRPGSPSRAQLVWRLEVRNALGDVNDFVLIDAQNGTVALNFSQVAHARNRRVCDANNAHAQVNCPTAVLTETGGTSTVADVNNTFAYMGHTYDFFANRFGRDSFNGAGASMKATVRFCENNNCSALNAFWDGTQAYFWPGLATDDVVAHEFGHAYTQYGSGLLYAFQSGAINEALSDVFGEFVDLTNAAGSDAPEMRWLVGEDTSIGPIRNMKNPPAFGHPDRMRSSNYDTDADFSDGGGVHHNSGVANKAAYLMVDGDAFNGQTVSGIGIDKTAAVWYRAAFHYLASGSDFEDLGVALNQSCTDLQGSSVKDSTGAVTGSIAAADCADVAKAVTATELALQPAAPGAAVPEAPVCTTGTPVNVFLDQFASSLSPWQPSSSRWVRDVFYATSNPGHAWGLTPDTTGSATLLRGTAVTVPSNAFLHFRHAHLFDSDSTGNFDGGKLAYQVGSGSWQDAGPLFTHNGYNGVLASGFGNPLSGQSAFTGVSWGYYSSRLDLSSLAGQSVRFRFRTGTDEIIGFDGWFIDDVRLYSCSTGGGGGDTTPPTVSPPTADLRTGVDVASGKKVRLVINFDADDESGVASTALQKRANSGSYSTVGLATPTSAFQGFPASSSTKRQFRAQATDDNGNTSAWVQGNPFRVLAHQNGSSAVTQSGSWRTGSSSSFYGGSVRYTGKAGARQSRTATASDFAIVSTLGPNRGRADVYVDNVYQTTLDLYSPTTRFRQVVYAIDFGTAGTHTIELRVTGTKNPSSSAKRVDFDAFLALVP